MRERAAVADGREVLSRISGLPKQEVQSIWEEVKENHRRWRSCPRHRFSTPEGGVTIGTKLVCECCGATADLVKISTYIEGYVAAGGNPDDVWPGFWEGRKGEGDG